MAGKKKERQMLFDLRGGRRGSVVKVVYATLAVLMGLSLFLVIGGFNIAELFSNNGSDEAAKVYEEQAERIEAELKKNPDEPELLRRLTRAQINAGNAQVTVEPSGARQVSTEAGQEFQRASQSWSEYLKATPEPDVGLALLVAPMLLQLAELATTYSQADSRIQAAAEAQQIVADQRPSVNAWTTLAFYSYFTDPATAEKARAEAKKLAGTKAEREAIDKQLDEFRKNSNRYRGEKAKFEKAQEKEASQAGGEAGGGAPSGENPFGGFSGGGLGE